MKVLFAGLSENILRFLLPQFLSEKYKIFLCNAQDLSKALSCEQYDYILVDSDNVEYDIISLMKNYSIKHETKWVFYSYQFSDDYINKLKRNGVFAALSKNIHPDFLFFKLRKIFENTDEEFLNLRRKFFRVDISEKENAKVTFNLPTIRQPVFGLAKQISRIGMHVTLDKASDCALFHEGLSISEIFLRLNGYRLEVMGKVIKKYSSGGVVLLFSDMDDFSKNQLGKYIYRKIDEHLSRQYQSIKKVKAGITE